MNLNQVQTALNDLPLGGIRYFDRIGSTNNEAISWAAQGTPDLSLVLADEQTAGRGRSGRTWYSPAESSMAFSLIIYPKHTEAHILTRLTALGALAVKDALAKMYALNSQIKWPNDILVRRQKLSGILTEATWDGDRVQALILGIGINIAPKSAMIANQYAAPGSVPATCLEAEIGKTVNRLELLKSILQEIIHWRARVTTQAFLAAWEASLAYRGEWVQVTLGSSAGKDGLPQGLEVHSSAQEEGMIIGLSQDGSLRLRTASGTIIKVSAGDIQLRPLKSNPKESQLI